MSYNCNELLVFGVKCQTISQNDYRTRDSFKCNSFKAPIKLISSNFLTDDGCRTSQNIIGNSIYLIFIINSVCLSWFWRNCTAWAGLVVVLNIFIWERYSGNCAVTTLRHSAIWSPCVLYSFVPSWHPPRRTRLPPPASSLNLSTPLRGNQPLASGIMCRTVSLWH